MQTRFLKSGIVAGLIAALVAPTFARAQDSANGTAPEAINMDSLRREFQSARGTQNGAAAANDFSVKGDDLEKRRIELLAQERSILNELQDGKGRPTSDTVDSAIVPTSGASLSREARARASSDLGTDPIGDEPIREAESSASLNKKLSSLITEKTSLEADLLAAKTKNKNLTKELEAARDRLMIAETEVERLSGMLRNRNEAVLASQNNSNTYRPPPQAVQPAQKQAAPQQQAPQKQAPAQKVKEEVLIGTVMVEKANLRTGPGKDNSPLMTVPYGTRLVIETRLNNSDWYRVVTPTGSRAWVSGEVLAFGNTPDSGPSGNIKIRAVSEENSDDPFKIVHSGTAR